LDELLPEAELSLDVLVWGEVDSDDLDESDDLPPSEDELPALDPAPPLRA
jgi:hypothetical protein